VKYEYTPAQYENCEQMRAKVRQWVAETRREKLLRTRGDKGT
jgi:hypothetical protein